MEQWIRCIKCKRLRPSEHDFKNVHFFPNAPKHMMHVIYSNLNARTFLEEPPFHLLKVDWTTFSTLGLTQEMIKALTSRAHFLQSLHCHQLVICMPFPFPIFIFLLMLSYKHQIILELPHPPLPSNLASPQKNGKRKWIIHNRACIWQAYDNVSFVRSGLYL